MIFGQINPVLSLATQDSLFNPSLEFITASYVTAVSDQYILGANQVSFRVQYGNCTIEDGVVTKFESIHSHNITLSGSAIETWGTDDSVILETIAAQQGTSVVEVVSGSINNF